MRLFSCLGLSLFPALLQAQCVNFPASYIPLTSVTTVTAPNTAGDQLVVGPLAGGLNGLAQLPLPASTNQLYCDAQVQLAPQQFYANVYVPTTQERGGNFSAFAGLLLDPATNQPFPGGIIPAAKLGTVYAFRIGPAQTSQAVKEWSPTGSSAAGGSRRALALLPNGKVLAVGNSNQAEIYDPSTGAFTATGGMAFNHGNAPTATLLSDGRVFILGGSSAPNNAELYDPASGKFSAIAATTIEPHAVFHTADLLPDGRVLIVGGLNGDENLSLPNSGAELFDPKTQTFTKVSSLAAKRRRHTTTALPDGRVLVIGGSNNTGDIGLIEAFNPTSGNFSILGSTSVGRVSAASSLLPNGKVLIAGGYDNAASAEIFDPVKGQSSATGSMSRPREETSAVILSNGQILIAGGGTLPTYKDGTNTADVYNPASGVFTPVGNMGTPRTQHPSITLLDGRVLVVDGLTGCCGPPFVGLNSSELYTPVTKGLVTSQSGLTFRAAQGIAAVAPQTVAVVSPNDSIAWSLSVKSFSGGNWLSATSPLTTSDPAAPPVPLTIAVDPTGLAAQVYYGSVTLTPTDGIHAPVSIAIVFNIVPAGTAAPLSVSPSGLVFLSKSGLSPQPQSFTISNVTSTAINFTAAGSAPVPWFDFNPKSGTITSRLPATITVTPSSSALLAGVYRGSIKLSFNDAASSTQTVDLLLVVSPGTPPSLTSLREAATPACTPSKLLPVATSIGTGFTAPVAWPAPLIVQVVDDCGAAVNTGSVIASFSNGDPPVSLLNIGSATWSGTWVPVRNSTSSSVRIDARLLQPALAGTVQYTGQVATNPKVPVVATGGILSSGDYVSSPALGSLISIFGSALADGSTGNTSLPLPPALGSTQVLLSGVNLPLLYVSENQVNVLVPYDTPINSPRQLVVQRGNAYSVPVPTAVFDAQPAILSTAGTGAGQGHVYWSNAGAQILAGPNTPTPAGSVLVIYCVGLGAVTPAVKGGDPAPSNPLGRVAGPVTVTIGGQTVQPVFAGLTPGFAGLYQVNVQMPSGLTSGNQVPVSISVGGKSSPGSIYFAVK